ncbi:MAG TPA: N-acetyltransferase [Thermodesulforhabdus norvegica]|uniref:N-acetyltransferase n=1 Tax=Thermodesulforhabdus norvegica TaxID=39841 RepID=A0A7C1AVW3_9BACT|nr:N-acetyltransferase [Deltaproteobacteria bacterium]MBW2068252.1 N-acetyltransferase [Deltaproteobacteria bacterium]HDL89958.1 N-acetyltransferase [Thermodesulforhabdus norvegica]
MRVRKAKVADVPVIKQVIQPFVAAGRMLPRSLSELYSKLRDFYVCEDSGGRIVGCCGLHIVWADLAEIVSLAVIEQEQRKGIGQRLVNACLEEAKDLGISRVFVLTYEQAFFEKLGFKVVDKSIFPHKIWEDCLKCPKFPECDEIAMLLVLNRGYAN